MSAPLLADVLAATSGLWRKVPKNSRTARDDGVKISKRLQNWQEEARKRQAMYVLRQGDCAVGF
jgi:hypothetical protein